MTGVSHNGMYRGKNLGSISSLNEYIAFRTAHGIADKTYNDLYLGDYFTVNDGTYNVEWMVAHFNYYYGKGANPSEQYPHFPGIARDGVVLIPRKRGVATVRINDTATSEGGYVATLLHTTHCPAVAAAMQTVFGSYLLKMPCVLTNSMSSSLISGVGGGIYGASNNTIWDGPYCVTPATSQVLDSANSSSPVDQRLAETKLAVFNFITTNYFDYTDFICRDVASATEFSIVTAGGYGAKVAAYDSQRHLRPLIYIG